MCTHPEFPQEDGGWECTAVNKHFFLDVPPAPSWLTGMKVPRGGYRPK